MPRQGRLLRRFGEKPTLAADRQHHMLPLAMPGEHPTALQVDTPIIPRVDRRRRGGPMPMLEKACERRPRRKGRPGMGQACKGKEFPAPGQAPIRIPEKTVPVARVHPGTGSIPGQRPNRAARIPGPDEPGQPIKDKTRARQGKTGLRPGTPRRILPVLPAARAGEGLPERIETGLLAGPGIGGLLAGRPGHAAFAIVVHGTRYRPR